ncbi:MAG: hypothetical protein CK534_06060 [Nitrospirae bacterium]|nr:MAG: hypothetical protein CK534_06060 [Nitrospirota bacterium]
MTRIAITEQLDRLLSQKLERYKRYLLESMAQEWTASIDDLTEADVMKQGRTQLIRRRIRKGKLQRNIRKSNVKGYTLKGKKLVRIGTAQRLKMKRGARRGALKRRGKMMSSLRKRKLSLRKRKTMGIH